MKLEDVQYLTDKLLETYGLQHVAMAEVYPDLSARSYGLRLFAAMPDCDLHVFVTDHISCRQIEDDHHVCARIVVDVAQLYACVFNQPEPPPELA